MSGRPSTAVFFVRAQWEDGRFWARVISARDGAEALSEERRVVTADPAEVGRLLAAWLAEIDTAS